MIRHENGTIEIKTKILTKKIWILMDNPILTMFSLCNYEKHMSKYPTDEMKEQMIRDFVNKAKISLYQTVLAIIAICSSYVLVKLVF